MRYSLEVPKVLRAIEVARKAHKGQKRKVSGQPYFYHPVAVAFILMSFKRSAKLTDLIVAAILHDTIEDTKLTFEQITKLFGSFVASLVLELTNDEKEIERLGKKEYQKRKLLRMSSYALLIKLVDRLHNVSESPTAEMKNDTLELMEDLLRIRSNMSRAQYELIAEIQKLCKK